MQPEELAVIYGVTRELAEKSMERAHFRQARVHRTWRRPGVELI
jgi:hypothetical protein